jgi:tetratricopeptide (TPR) repeat protein
MPWKMLIAVGLVIATAPALRAQTTGVALIPLIESYYEGRHDEAIARAAAIADLGPLRLRFVQDTPGWVVADPARADARRAAVAGFLLELTAARLESDWGRLSDLIEWTCVQLRTNQAPSEFERAWHAASHALAGRARARQWLLGAYATLPHQKPFSAPPPENQPPPARHLMHALERFPDDPQFQLSRVVAWTWGRDAEPIRNVRARNDNRPLRTRRPPQMEALVTLEPLTAVKEVAAEAFVRIGAIQFTANDFAASLRAFERAQAIATEAAVQYVAFLSAGRALEALQRPDEAMGAYRRALEIVPDAESATVALASLQFQRDERDAAVTMIDRVFNRLPGNTDPGRLIIYGSYLRWPSLKAALRMSFSSYPAVPR